MKIFSTLYEKSLLWSQHRLANVWLGIVSFTESSVFILPPDFMLAPMTLAKPQQWLRLTIITTITSVLGGVFGYLIGLVLINEILPLLQQWGQMEKYQEAKNWFLSYGVLSILVASFTPIPYKIFTIAAGALSMNLPLFILMSLIGRGTRYGLICWLIKQFGNKIINYIHKYMDWIGWSVVILIAIYIGLRWTL